MNAQTPDAVQAEPHRERLRCRLGWHAWTKWTYLADAEMTTLWGTGQPVEIQQRACTACGKKDRHTVLTR